ncbi:hypothetical protein DTO013E5_4348 [Penicillium roqueforti]|uniref:uncharacterized protein n=1 Tax=Penicillium roqueforti TaxID=5082 RepID=UPI00190D79A5|nr:uncharacterized protein LCP9604111_8820 [Penicillium roqueforti]KAF9240342.1 hypothetical protein LCP9604111_8820 [Penicillium roqueforti]KAI1835285.1 hypothetical protein CBS147337_4102 [Penicillium roqueforti]KAI2677298.1 hypothetical protein CBS147355_5525 [Penicillium roqueforti]KAI2688405.1 hypothetical protein LCP963914a_2807 [Penicillium roqueforti]KAI2700582.1 hypothetical protein CBS147372_5361 [Penicillium roqueforti]
MPLPLLLSSSPSSSLSILNYSYHFSSRQWSHTTATIFATSLNSRHHPFNGRRSSNRGGASDCAPYIR